MATNLLQYVNEYIQQSSELQKVLKDGMAVFDPEQGLLPGQNFEGSATVYGVQVN